MRRSTVQIGTVETSPTTLDSRILGTGFLADEGGWVVTAAHVVRAAAASIGSQGGHLTVGFAGPNYDAPELKIRAVFVKQHASLVAIDETNDLALLRTSTKSFDLFRFSVGPKALPTNPTPVRLRPGRATEGESVAVSGYPIGEPALVTTAGTLASVWAHEPVGSDRVDRYLADVTANPGNSGGPVYAVANGEVLGVCVANRLAPILGGAGFQAAGLMVVIPSDRVIELLAKHVSAG